MCLQDRLWKVHDISLSTKIAVYRAVVLTSLSYGSETWTLYRHQILKLDQFHMRCLRSIARIKWQDRVPNTSVLKICGLTGIEAMLLQAQFRWLGHVISLRMPDTRIPKQIFDGQLMVNRRLPGGPVSRYEDSLKTNLKTCGIDPRELIHAPFNKSAWRSRCRNAVTDFEDRRVDSLRSKRARRKGRRIKVSGRVTSAFVNPGLDCSPIGDHTESRLEGSVGSTAQSRVSVCVSVIASTIAILNRIS